MGSLVAIRPVPPIVLAAADAPSIFPLWLQVLLHLAAVWIVVTALLGAISGHLRLLSAYRPVEEPVAQTFPLATGILGRIPFRAPLHVAIGRKGLHIAPSWVFRPPTHWGIPCIPWWDVRCTRSQGEPRDGDSRSSAFEVVRVGARFEVSGEAGRAIERALAAAGDARRA